MIDTTTPFEEYIKSLSSHARKDYAYICKHNADLQYEQVPFDKPLVEQFMALWAKQLVRNKSIEWAFGAGYVEELAAKGELLVFKASKGTETLAMHFIQERQGYWECHPPMYDKKYNARYLAKFMWFNLIRFGSEKSLGFLNMGGGVDSWREMIKRRDEFPNPKYKWIYIPQAVKDNPDLQPDYYIENHALRVRKTN